MTTNPPRLRYDISLREALVSVCDDKLAIKELAKTALIDWGDVDSSGNARNVWDEVILHARQQRKLRQLLDVTSTRYSKNDGLQRALNEYDPSDEGIVETLRNSSSWPPLSHHETEIQSTATTMRSLRMSISRLPATASRLFGRSKELRHLNRVLRQNSYNVVCLIAWGGAGKTAILNAFINSVKQAPTTIIHRIYAWSFWSQGVSEQALWADEFIDHALRWFGDPDPTQGSPWSKGERLAQLIKSEPTLLILDGLEPVQFPGTGQYGQLKDRSLQALLKELAADNPGLCLISSRLPVTDLASFEESTVNSLNLDHISPKAGAQFLRSMGVYGSRAALEAASNEYQGHCLSITLLGTYLCEALGGSIVERHRMNLCFSSSADSADPARRAMAAYEKWFEDSAALDLLHIIGLFDRPVDYDTLSAIRNSAKIYGLTDRIALLDDMAWNRLVFRLRKLNLLADAHAHDTETLDAHPLVREYFGQRLLEKKPTAWKEANSWLFDHLSGRARALPESLEEMGFLYSAVAHGCKAGRFQESLDEVYWPRIARHTQFYSTRVLGAFGTDLAALAHFFRRTWTELAFEFSVADTAFLFGQVGFHLWTLGRLRDMAQPQRAALKASCVIEDWANACRSALNLTDLYVTLGKLDEAFEIANEGVAFGDLLLKSTVRADSKCFAQQCMNLAGGADDMLLPIVMKASLADVQHHRGKNSESLALFQEAEYLQRTLHPQFQFLYSISGSWYCDLLLALGRAEDVRIRAQATMEWAQGNDTLAIALDCISLGRAWEMTGENSGTSDTSLAEQYLQRAVACLRSTGHQDYLPEGLHARASYWLNRDRCDLALADLHECLEIAQQADMRLHLIECHLALGHVSVHQRNKSAAEKHALTAHGLLQNIGFHKGKIALDGLLRSIAQL